MGTVEKAEQAEQLLRDAVGLLGEVHGELYALNTDTHDKVADEFDAAQGEVEFALKYLPDTIAKTKELLAAISDS
jgi:hypothetical protein